MQAITPELADILVSKFMAGAHGFAGRIEVAGVPYACKSMSLDKSLRLQADQLTVELDNEDGALGWGATSIFPTNSRIRAFQWYGDEANAVQVFDGLIDNPKDHRDVRALTLTCTDRFQLLIDQTFSASAPQAAGETGAVRTPANGVYLSMEASDIVSDILDRVGWPAADRAITPSSFVVDELILSDGSTYADGILGNGRLSDLTGYNAWSDELGIFHFAPTPASDIVTVDVQPAYTWRAGVDLIALDDSTDQDELITRAKARGPLTTTTQVPSWTETWRTSKFAKPVGLWYDPTDATHLRVIDRGTKRLYKLRQSDRVVVSNVYLGGAIPHPLGLSGDPSNSAIYWVLNAPWIDGISGGNSVKKVRKSDNAVLATYALPSGRWSAIKVSTAFIWLTNLDTDRFYKRSKTDASAIANYSHVVGATTQLNPSGLMVDGTTLFLFWANGGTTARFLKCDESAPGTVTGTIKTTGTTLHGGEMDTTTHVDCYGDSDSLGLVAKFTLVTPLTTTRDVSVEVIDTALEDELGALAELENRIHDSHPLDAAHPWESRRGTLDLSLLTSLAQANDSAMFWLDKNGRRRRVVDAGIIGNPAIQKNDLIRVEDPVSGIAQNFIIDTYRSLMSANGTFVGTVALIRGGVANEVITEDPPAGDLVPVSYVQERGFDGNNIVLDNAPTDGHLLTWFVASRSVDLTTPSGWTLLDSCTSFTGGSSTRYGRVYYRIASGENNLIEDFSGVSGLSMHVFEWADGVTLDTAGGTFGSISNQVAPGTLASVVVTPSTTSTVVGNGLIGSNDVAAIDVAPGAGVDQLWYSAPTGFSPRSWVGIVTDQSGASDVDLAVTGTNGWGGTTYAVHT